MPADDIVSTKHGAWSTAFPFTGGVKVKWKLFAFYRSVLPSKKQVLLLGRTENIETGCIASVIHCLATVTVLLRGDITVLLEAFGSPKQTGLKFENHSLARLKRPNFIIPKMRKDPARCATVLKIIGTSDRTGFIHFQLACRKSSSQFWGPSILNSQKELLIIYSQVSFPLGAGLNDTAALHRILMLKILPLFEESLWIVSTPCFC